MVQEIREKLTYAYVAVLFIILGVAIYMFYIQDKQPMTYIDCMNDKIKMNLNKFDYAVMVRQVNENVNLTAVYQGDRYPLILFNKLDNGSLRCVVVANIDNETEFFNANNYSVYYLHFEDEKITRVRQ